MRSWKTSALSLASGLVVAALSAAPAVAAPAPTPSVGGTVASVSVDDFGAPSATPQRDDRVLLADDGRVVPLASDPRSTSAAAGDQVRAVISASREASASVVATKVAATVARPSTPLAERMYVVAIQDADTDGSFTPASATTVATTAAAYWKGQARGAITSFSIVSSAALSLDDSCGYDYTDLWEQAAAVYPDVDFAAPGNHLAVFSPEGCAEDYGYAGVANVGTGFATGGYIQVIGSQWGILAHELGHHFGLGHTFLALADDYGVGEYEYWGLYGPQALQVDDFEPGVLDGAYRARLGIPGEAARERRIAWNSRAATYSIAPLTATSGTTSLVIPGPDGDSELYLDYRSGAGTDARTLYASTGNRTATGFDEGDVTFGRGVHLTLPDDADGDLYTIAVPTSAGRYRGAAAAGDVLTLWGGRVTLRIGSQTAAGAQVTVTYAARPAVATTSRISVPSVVEGSKGKVSVSVSAGATGSVSVYQDGTKIATRTLVGGRTLFSTPHGLKAGKRTFTVRYAGDPASKASSASTTVIVKDRSSVSASAKKVRQGTAGTVSVRVHSDVAATGYVKLYRGSTYVTKAKVSHGRATLRTPKSWKHKTYSLTVKYTGSSAVTSSTTKVKLVVRAR
ncbi:Ig-like domain repeat protein [Cellulomonas sp. JH27-2]|uniref:Ig-like domain repeat protein n=1 Tax=Cellulomonas sp. JH27-2 TaxID=2774139 RepID=UPI00177B29BC|nr:Ig-like domain repeat protein [Cellulomonas sp. JH27-2]MBD8059703.1 Ig-like domain repeat protein [Cellulomonas sp. JH27-2]